MIINSILDLDFYKLTMMALVYEKYPTTQVEYEFICRSKDIDFTPYFKEIKYTIYNLKSLYFSGYDIRYLNNLKLFNVNFLKYLSNFKLTPTDNIECDLVNGKLKIKVHGLWVNTILYETLILSIINEIYFKDKDNNTGVINLDKKIELIDQARESFKFADFGTRRRYSSNWHEYVLRVLQNKVPENLIGTSNVYFAKQLGLKPIGTMAHEYIMAHQTMVHPIHSQAEALKVWAEMYRGNLGIALTDTISMDSFLDSFDLFYAKLYDGLRHDSGDPYIWADKAIAHYGDLGIDPMTKTLVFSDGLDFKTAIELYNEYKTYINVSFGIGTNLMNDCGHEPLSIVMKMTSCNGLPVAKISDEPIKAMCKSTNYLNYLKEIFKIN